MSEAKDPAIKLFGKTIPLPESPTPTEDYDSGGAEEDIDCDEALSCRRQSDGKHQNDRNHNLITDEVTDPNEISLVSDNPNNPTADYESSSSKALKSEEEQSETNISQDKTLKKPDKILPCPRCNSMDTKFCYYNNYNVNQPRHFCKKCQRYWTAGGTMRNVPVGAGRRKNKNSASQYSHINVSQTLQNVPNGAHYPTIRPNGAVLTFGPDTPLCESMASVLIADKRFNNCGQNGFHKPENLKILVPNNHQSSMSSVTVANGREQNGPNGVIMQNCHSYPPQVPILAGPPWPYPINMAHWVPPPGVIPSGYPMPFYPAPTYWSCAVPPPWTVPFVNPPLSTSPNSPTLGKHCREENTIKQSSLPEEGDEKGETSTERSLWIPKTLRIDDPGEAAKSSIWETLGIKPEKCDSSSGGGGIGGLFKAFQSKADKRSESSNTSSVLKANPAALLRSRNYQESS